MELYRHAFNQGETDIVISVDNMGTAVLEFKGNESIPVLSGEVEEQLQIMTAILKAFHTGISVGREKARGG